MGNDIKHFKTYLFSISISFWPFFGSLAHFKLDHMFLGITSVPYIVWLLALYILGVIPKIQETKAKKNRQMELCSLKAKGIINRVKTRQDGYSVWSF